MEKYYDDDNESYDENSSEEYVDGDDSDDTSNEEEMRGGNYQLYGQDYFGNGGVMYGGTGMKRKPTAYNKFVKKMARMGYTMKQISSMWKRMGSGSKTSSRKVRGRGYAGGAVPPQLASYAAFRRKYAGKGFTREMLANLWTNERPTTKNPPKNPPRIKKTRIDLNTQRRIQACNAKDGRYCPITKRCRRLPDSIADCYDEFGIPYYTNDKGIPTSGLIKTTGKTYASPEQLQRKFPNETIWYMGKEYKKKTR